MNSLLKSKTFWAGVAAVITAVGGYSTGDLTPAAAIQVGLTGIVGIFLRDAIRTETKSEDTKS